MKLFSYYDNNIDHAWFESSDIVYSECIDNENELKTLKVVFSNGAQYEFYDVNVFDYLKFRDGSSQGKAFITYIRKKKYKFKKLEKANLKEINEEYIFRTGNGIFIEENDGNITFYNSKNEKIGDVEKVKDLTISDLIKKSFKLIGFEVKEKENNN